MPLPRPLRSTLLFLAAAVTLGGCAPGPGPEGPLPETPEEMERAGAFTEAAEAYARQAEEATGEEAARLRYRQGRALALGGEDVEALGVLEELVETEQAERAALLRARIHIRHQRFDAAQRLLDNLVEQRGDIGALPTDLQEEALDYVAQLELAQGRPEGAFDALVERHRVLRAEEEQEANIARIRYLLASVPEQVLTERIDRVGKEFPGGYLRFERIMRRSARQPLERTGQQLEEWLETYSGHPLADIVRDRLDRVQEAPLRVAVLLPLDSRYRPLADAILRGMLAAYYQTDQGAGIQLDIFDTGGNGEGLDQALEQVYTEDYAAVIGPLTRAAARAYADREQRGSTLPPTLLLNTTNNWAKTDRKVFQVGLDPETEAAQVAERAFQVGHRRAGILFPQTQWGERMVGAFQQRWEELGGTIRAMESFDTDSSDYSDTLQTFLALDRVSARRQGLEHTLQVDLPEYDTPPRREDLDFLFLASETLNARLIRPQLEFFAAGDLPVLATSHTHSPDDSRSDRRDMDDIHFQQLPWFLEPRPEHQRAATAIEESYSGQQADMERLNALGYDAYSLVVGAWRRSLLLDDPLDRALANIRLEGATGQLAADADGRIQRQLQWAEYRHGRIIPLPAMLTPAGK
ncbi:MAG: penicillin-binding protein activator [Thiohalospira sp.]|uniref:penicillin-binding protein activator n=1 Tax=Thiohalorhabdus sp. TaxID=3094134 RepID=UPI00398044A3